jgi:hypothetical protein
MNPNCLERRESTVAPQALHLMNNGMVHRLAEQFADRVRREAGPDPAIQIEKIYWIALGRPPNDEERAVALEAVHNLTQTWARHQAPGDKPLVTFCHAVLNSAAFLYVD